MFSVSLQLLAASDDDALEREKILAWIHSMPEMIFALRCLCTALHRKRERPGEVGCIARDIDRILALHSLPRG